MQISNKQVNHADCSFYIHWNELWNIPDYVNSSMDHTCYLFEISLNMYFFFQFILYETVLLLSYRWCTLFYLIPILTGSIDDHYWYILFQTHSDPERCDVVSYLYLLPSQCSVFHSSTRLSLDQLLRVFDSSVRVKLPFLIKTMHCLCK